MNFIYFIEHRKFCKEWEKLYQICKEAGMPEKAIQTLYEFDWELFKKERTFCRHNQYMPGVSFEDRESFDEGKLPLLHKFLDAFTTNDEKLYFNESRFGWLEDIENKELHGYLSSLGEDRLELLTRYVFEGKTQEEIAEEMGISRSAVADRLQRIRREMKKYI